MRPRPLDLVVSHALATAVVIVGSGALAGLSWFALFAWAIAAGTPLGGPLAFPFMVGGAVLAATIAVFGSFLPITAASEFLCARWLAWPTWAQIPLATTLLLLQILVVTTALGPLPSPLTAVLAVALLLSLGAYWWSVQASHGLIRLAHVVWRRVTHLANPALQPPTDNANLVVGPRHREVADGS